MPFEPACKDAAECAALQAAYEPAVTACSLTPLSGTELAECIEFCAARTLPGPAECALTHYAFSVQEQRLNEAAQYQYVIWGLSLALVAAAALAGILAARLKAAKRA
jgi:hypothetical protein